MNKIKSLIASTLVMVGLIITPLAMATPTFAAINPQEEACTGTGGSFSGGKCTTAGTTDLTTIITKIVQVLLFIIGAVAVIMIIVGAFRFVTSGGNASSVTAAKNTILYAVIGLVIAILAFAIVHFVTQNIK